MNDPNSRSSRDVMRYDIVIFCHVRLALNRYILSELLFALFLVFTEKSLPDLDANPSILSTAKNMIQNIHAVDLNTDCLEISNYIGTE